MHWDLINFSEASKDPWMENSIYYLEPVVSKVLCILSLNMFSF